MSLTVAKPSFDPRLLVLPDTPPEWADVPRELIDYCTPAGALYSPEQAALMDRIAQARWFLLRNEFSFRSRGTGQVERYFTLAGVERPFNGYGELLGMLREIVPLDENRRGDRLVDVTLRVQILGAIEPISATQALARFTRMRERGRGALVEPYMREIMFQIAEGPLPWQP